MRLKDIERTTLNRRDLILGMAGAGLCSTEGIAFKSQTPGWTKLPTEAYRGKQDDIYFVSRRVGWYGNGLGRIYRTEDGGDTWIKLRDKPGTFIRAIGFVDDRVGIFGNIGPGSFPNVTDENPIYRTEDGGRSWVPVVDIDGPRPAGICAIDVLRQPFVNSGILDHRITLRAGGRVGGPAFLMTSRDEGRTWHSEDMRKYVAMILDIKFLNERTGFIAGASNEDVSVSNAVVIRTDDGGRSWRTVYQSRRPYEITWKLSFPSRSVGFVTVQNYDERTDVSHRVVGKTDDGGNTWRELPLVVDHGVQELGVLFIDERRGWVGATPGGFYTANGGRTWSPADIGRSVNKFRAISDVTGTRLFAIGSEVRRLDLDR